jgi:hypothetical protein
MLINRELIKIILFYFILIFCFILFGFKLYSKFNENWVQFYDDATSLLPLNSSESLEALRVIKSTYYTGQTHINHGCFVDKAYSKQINNNYNYYQFIGAYGNIRNDVRYLVYHNLRKNSMCYQIHDQNYFSQKVCFNNENKEDKISFIKTIVEFCFLNSRGSSYFYF